MEFKHKPVLLEETIHGLNIKENGILLDEENSMYIQGVLMAMLGYCVIETKDLQFDAYIPKAISKLQYAWFNENIEEVNNYKVSAVIIDDKDEIIHIKKNPLNDDNPIAKLYKKLEEIVEVENKNDIRRSK